MQKGNDLTANGKLWTTKNWWVKIYQQKDQLLKQKKDTYFKNLLKIEEMLAQYSAITGKLIELLGFLNTYLWVLLKKKTKNGTFPFTI